jgi:hypothetical protein
MVDDRALRFRQQAMPPASVAVSLVLLRNLWHRHPLLG